MNYEEIAHKIDYAVKCAANVTVELDDPEWCELVFVTFGDDLSIYVEPIKIGAVAARVKVRGEVARLYLHMDDFMSLAPMLHAIRMALEPFVMGNGREFVAHDFPKGLVIALIDDREVNAIHDASEAAKGFASV
jgi:hypothetical protein